MHGLPDTSSGRLYISQYILEFLNGCISFNIGPINTKLEDVANFNMLFLTIRVSCRLSHIINQLVPSPSGFETRQCGVRRG